MIGENPREIAIRVLLRREGSSEYVERLLELELNGRNITPANRALCQELIYGMVRWQTTLDWLVARKTGGRDQNATLRLLLHLGLYQLFWLERIPQHAAVFETTELCKSLGFAYQSGFINAILRTYTRESDDTRVLLENLKSSEPAVGFSHPRWLEQKWTGRWGAATAAQLMEWNNRPPAVFARLNQLKATYGQLTDAWQGEGIECTEQSWDWTGRDPVVELKKFPSLSQSKSFQAGFFYIQDPSTLLAVKELDPQPGETILDLCAAPGGKTAYIAQRMQNQGKIVARDIQPDRLKRVQENCERLGVTCAEFSPPALGEQFDRILVDAPCSNTGVMRRRVDLRWRITEAEIQRLAKTQSGLLEESAPKVKPGGVLLYSTCSLEIEENETVAKAFAAALPEFKLEYERKLLPFADGVDGAYIARFRKTN